LDQITIPLTAWSGVGPAPASSALQISCLPIYIALELNYGVETACMTYLVSP